MSRAKRRLGPILVASEMAGRRAESLARWAAAFSRRFGGQAEIAHVEDSGLYLPDSALYRPLVSRHLKRRARHLLEGVPAVELLKLSHRKQNRFSMICTGTRGHGLVVTGFLGSVAEEIARHATIPVMALGPRVTDERPGSRLQSGVIVVAVDLREGGLDARTLGFAKQVSRSGGRVPIVLVHSLRQGMHPVLKSARSTRKGRQQLLEWETEMASDAEKKLARMIEELSRSQLPAKGWVLDRESETAAEAVLRAADVEKAALIICGTHGRGWLGRAFVGSVSRELVVRSAVPVISVR